MVAINTSERVQRIFVPLPMPAPQDRVALKAQNTTDHSEVVFDIQRWDVQGSCCSWWLASRKTGSMRESGSILLLMWTAMAIPSSPPG